MDTQIKLQAQIFATKSPVWEIIILGAGFAGLTAAIYAARAGRSVLVLESNLPGGQITTSHLVENWPAVVNPISGMELGSNLEAQVKRLGVPIEWAMIDSLTKLEDTFCLVSSEKNYYAQTVIVATGVNPKTLNIAGESEYRGRGVSYCATCDGSFYRGKEVAVIGGGNSALEEALYLAKIVKKVYLIHRRDSFRADQIVVQKVHSTANISLVLDSIPLQILGADGLVSGINLKNVKSEETNLLAVDGVFIYVGSIPNTGLLSALISLDEQGYAVAAEDTRTKVPGLFVAGDIRRKPLKQLVTAASDGAVAAMMADHFLR